jgi:hypothetical protein
MPVAGPNTQRDPRFAVPPELNGRVEFRYPNRVGRVLMPRLHDISVSGVAFSLDHELPLMVRGARIEDAVVRIGDLELGGRLLVRHGTGTGAGTMVYGCVFYPSTERDLALLDTALVGLEQRGARGREEFRPDC